MASLKRKVAIVTGASRGIERATAERLGQEDAFVVVNYSHSAEKAQEVVATIKVNGTKASATDVVVFISSEQACWLIVQNICVAGGLA